jgi:hypothetical protein
MKLSKSALFFLLLLSVMFSWIQVPDASSAKRVTLKVPFPDVAG